jgi:hypothetical protein
MPPPTDPIMEKMLAILERLGNAQPVVNVNIQMPDGKKRKAVQSPETEQKDFETGGYPRPYVS